MQLLLDIAGIILGMVVGVWVGFSVGKRFETRRTTLWWFVAPLIASAWVLDLAGTVSGHPEVSLSSIGLMTGLLTGVKYGAFPDIRVWEKRGPLLPAPPGSRRDDAPASQDTDASRKRV